MEIAEQLNRDAAAAPGTDTRFKKGQSGNPRGRPRKVTPVDDPRWLPAEESLYEMVRGEACRPVRVRSGERSIEMSAMRAGLREMSLKAAKGNRLALTGLMQLLLQTEAAEARRAATQPARQRQPERLPPTAAIAAAEEYKDVWTRVLVDAARTGATLDPPAPHPDEVTIGHVGGTVSWPGSVPGEMLSLNPLAQLHAEMAAQLPEQRTEIEALPHGHAKMVALCGWFEQDDLRRAIARNLPERYYVQPDADGRAREEERRTREWAQLQRHDFEWIARKAEEREAEVAAAGSGEVAGNPQNDSREALEAEPKPGLGHAATASAGDGQPESVVPAIGPAAVEPPQRASAAEAQIYVRAWNAALRKAEELGLPDPGPTLHPDDVVIDERAGTVGYRKPPKGDAAATIAQAREGLAQLRRMVGRYAQDMAWTKEGDELQLVLRKIEGAKAVCAAMEGALGE